jgi:transposase IS66 family protein
MRKLGGKPPDEVLAVRQSEMKPLVDKLFAFLKETIAEETFVPSDPFLKAAGYTLTRETALRVFLDDPNGISGLSRKAFRYFSRFRA